MGAPNVLRGKSHSENISAADVAARRVWREGVRVM
jgi:alpha-D-ribose 1-methylphosphonate 5-triphosphate diphosphatase PhnM